MTKEELKQLSDDTFTSNNDKQITADNHRNFNNQLIETMTTQEDFDAYEIPDGAVTTEKLADRNVSQNKLSYDALNGVLMAGRITKSAYNGILFPMSVQEAYLHPSVSLGNASYDASTGLVTLSYSGIRITGLNIPCLQLTCYCRSDNIYIANINNVSSSSLSFYIKNANGSGVPPSDEAVLIYFTLIGINRINDLI